MNSTSNKRSGLLLIELVLSLLIFSLCAGICLRIFAFAKVIADDSHALTGAIFAATTAAEQYKASGGNIYAETRYDADWNEADNGIYLLSLFETDDGAKVVVATSKSVLYTLTVKAVIVNE